MQIAPLTCLMFGKGFVEKLFQTKMIESRSSMQLALAGYFHALALTASTSAQWRMDSQRLNSQT